MGLGKTLQSICIIAGDHLNRAEAYKVCTILTNIVVMGRGGGGAGMTTLLY